MANLQNQAILVVGAGSIGERHISVLQALGFKNIVVLRSRNLPLRTVDSAKLVIVTSFQEAAIHNPWAAIICTPTSLHEEQTLEALHIGCHVLVEKPLAHTVSGLSGIKQVARTTGRLVKAAYMLPFHPLMERVGHINERAELGRLVSMFTFWGEYLPDWHPWEDYRQSYAALPELGGGAALTLSHDIDLVMNLAEKPIDKWQRMENHNSGLGIRVETGAFINIAFQGGVTAHCHLSMHERVPRRFYRFSFEEGSLEIDYLQSKMQVLTPGGVQETTLADFDRNDMFKKQWIAFCQSACQPEFIAATTEAEIKKSEKIIEICTR